MPDSIEEQVASYAVSQLEFFGAFGLVILTLIVGGGISIWFLWTQLCKRETELAEEKEYSRKMVEHTQQLNEDFRDFANNTTAAVTKFNESVPLLVKRRDD